VEEIIGGIKMGLSKEVYQALEAIVGPENISDDPAICQAYARGGYGTFVYDKGHYTPACVILPGNTKEVQEVVKVANRYRIPYIPFSTYYLAFCAPARPNVIMMDLKRMNKLISIDEKNMYAVVEPYVTHSQLQKEAFKRGMYHQSLGCGGQASVLANTIYSGLGPLGYRVGFNGTRRLLGVEWVLPDGELLKLGSPSILREYFWGEGPGPDLRGIIRGLLGHCGGLGVITKIAVKLFSWVPPSEAPLEPTGVTPKAALKLPTNRIKWYNVHYSNMKDMIEGMYEISKAEIGAMVHTVPPAWLYIPRTESGTDFWEKWSKDKEKFREEGFYFLRVLLVGFTSEKQLEYEERVLKEIASETGATRIREGRPFDRSWIIGSDSLTVYRIAGAELSPKFVFDSIDDAAKLLKGIAELRDKQVPPFYDIVDAGWIHSNDLGHMAYGEFLLYFDSEDADEAEEFETTCIKHDLKMKSYSACQNPGRHRMLGPKMGNYHLLLEKIKKAFDPNNVSNPPKPVDRV
jgi:FAD/FMN-containing dehydrogenase